MLTDRTQPTYDLDQVTGLDIFLSKWGSPYIAHTIMSWEFATGPPLAISIETRKEKGEEYSAVRGFFRQFELYYVIADERDVIGVRASHRGEQVSLYRLAVPPDVARGILVTYLQQADRLARQPKLYNALSHNCTTTIRLNVLQTGDRATLGLPDPGERLPPRHVLRAQADQHRAPARRDAGRERKVRHLHKPTLL